MTDPDRDDAMRDLLKDLPRFIDPPRDLYPAIATRISERKEVSLERARRRWLLLAAAAVLVVASSAITARLLQPARYLPAAIALPAGVRAVEANYVKATQDLEEQLAVERGHLNPATVAVVERNLHIINEAIGESRDALAKDPGNREAARLLWNTYQQKLELLQRATRLVSS